MGNPAGVRRDFGALERRRMEAAELLKQCVSQSEVARRLGVHRQSVIRWARRLAHSGEAGLKKVGRDEGSMGGAQSQTKWRPAQADRTRAQARTRGAGIRRGVLAREPRPPAD